MAPRAVTRSDRRSIVVSAPVRLDFAGGWTDVAPFATTERGLVVNAAIDLRTRVELWCDHDRYELLAGDAGSRCTGSTVVDLSSDGAFTLPKAAIRRARLGPCMIRTSATAPAGSGLGSSGALSVALVQACNAATDTVASPVETAESAWELETIDAAVAGGKQDQFAAALGGFNLLAFDRDGSQATALALEAEFAETLARHTVLCYTGQSRFSGQTITRVMAAYADGDRAVADALRGMAECATEMAEAMLMRDLIGVGRVLQANWLHQLHLDAAMRTPAMAALEKAMARVGAVGGKAAGSGAGGSMFFIVPGDPGPAIAAARAAGARVLPVAWARDGVRVE
jgi:D-glycero-alpha-D-manno-heptose-7-phosphate kinase